MDRARLRQIAPFVVPFIILAAGWMLFVRPLSSESTRAARRIETLRQRVVSVQASVGQAGPPVSTDATTAFEHRVAARDATSQLLEELTQLALNAGVRNLRIDSTGTRVPVTAPGAGPRVSGTSEPDPRISLFKTPLVYSPVPMSFDSGYEALGELLWRMRDMPTLIEIRALEVKPRVVQSAAGAGALDRDDWASDGTVSVSLTLFAYARSAAAPVATAGSGDGR